MTTPTTTTSTSRDSNHEKPKKKRSEAVKKDGNGKHHHNHDTSCSHATSSPKRVSSGIKELAAAAPPRLGRGVSLGTGADAAAAAASPRPSSKYSSAIVGLATVNPPNLDRGVSLGTAMSPKKSPKRSSKSSAKKNGTGISSSAVLEFYKESLPTSLAPIKAPAAVSEDNTATINKGLRQAMEKSASYRRPKKENDEKEKLLEVALVKAESFRLCRKEAGEDMLLDQSLLHGLNVAAATPSSLYQNKSDEEDEHEKGEDDHDNDEEVPQKRVSRGREKPGRPSKNSGRTSARSPSSRDLAAGHSPRKSKGTIKKSGSGARLDSRSPSGRELSRSPSRRELSRSPSRGDISRSPSGRDLGESSRRSTASKRISDGGRASPTGTSPSATKRISGGNLHSPRRKPSESTMKKSGSGGNLHSPRRKPSTMKKVGSGENLHSPRRKPSTMKKVGSNKEMEDSSRRAKRPPTSRRRSPGGVDSVSDHGGGKRISESSRRNKLRGGLDSASDHGGKRISESSHRKSRGGLDSASDHGGKRISESSRRNKSRGGLDSASDHGGKRISESSRRKKNPASSTGRHAELESPSNHAKPRISESRRRDPRKRDDKSPRRTKSAADVDDSSATGSFPDIDMGEDDGDEFENDTGDRNSRRRENRSERNTADDRRGRGYRGRVRKNRSEADVRRNQLADAVALNPSGDDGGDDSADEEPDQSGLARDWSPTAENGDRHAPPNRLASAGLGVGLLKNVATTVASTAANTTLNVASKVGQTVVGTATLNAASTTAKTTMNAASNTAKSTLGVGLHVGTATVNAASSTAKSTLGVGLHVGTASALTSLKAFTTISHVATSAAATALHTGKSAIYGEGANDMMLEGVPPGHSLAKIANDKDHGAIEKVNAAWKQMKKIRNYEEKAGIELFTHLFEHSPPAKGVFGFPVDADPKSDAIRKSPAFKQHSTYLIEMLDKALEMLKSYGAASAQLSTILFDLGKKHARLGVEPQYFPYMGAALMETLRVMLGKSRFTADVERSFVVVYNVLAAEICNGMHSDLIVLESWKKVKLIPSYKEKTGLLLFKHLFEECPETKLLFGFDRDFPTDLESLKSSMKFRMHAEYFILMFDKALGMVEAKTLDKHMNELGQKHVDYGVKVEYFPVMGQGLFHALEVLLKNDFNDEAREAWLGTYSRMSSKVVSVMRAAEGKKK